MIRQNPNLNFSKVEFNPFEEEKEISKVITINEPQREIWLSCMIGGDPASLAYNESISLDLKGNFHADYFYKALKQVVKRHEALRATISPNGESLIVYNDLSFTLENQDLRKESPEEQRQLIQKFVNLESSNPFDLQNGPLFRVFLHQLADDHHYFTLVIHHIIGDGWSLGIILEDLSKSYNAYVNGENPVIPDGPQISTYASDQAAFISSLDFENTESFWLNLYKDHAPVLDLPTDYPRPAKRSYKANRFDYTLPGTLIDQLKKTGAQSGCSLVNTLLAAFELYLYQLTKQEDLVVGLPASGQSATGNNNLVGHCVNLLPLKSNIDPDLSFKEFLKVRKSAFLDAYEHQQFSFGQLIKKLNIKRDHSRIPLIPVIFNIDMGMDSQVHFDQLNYELISNPRAYETFEIFLNATGSRENFLLEWTYNTQLFKGSTIEKMANDFDHLLQSLVLNPDIKLRNASFYNTNQELEVQATNVRLPKDKNINELLTLTALTYPDKVAVRVGNEVLTYKELHEKANQLSALLIEENVKPGDFIGLAADRSLEMLVCLLAILRTGTVYIPLDPEYPKERIEFMLEDASAKVLLLSSKHAASYQTDTKQIVIEDLWPKLNNYPVDTPSIQVSGDNLAYVLYTSGSTGKPKGVEISHDNLVNFLLGMQEEPRISASDRLLAITTISFDIAGLELYLPLISGAELIIANTDVTRDGRLLLNIIEQQQVSIMQATPSTWQMIIDSGWQKKYNLKALSGGEPLSRELAEQLLNRTDTVWNMYGPTETTIWSTLKKVTSTEGVMTIGHPIRQTQVYIMDELGRPTPKGSTGELYIGGAGVAKGYLNRPELTAEKFVKDPFSTSFDGLLYKTGDLAKFLDNGELQCLGRIDQQVKIRGHRIELGEIESLIATQNEIKQAVVVAREDSSSGKRLVAYVLLHNVPEENSNDNEVMLSKEQVKSWVKDLSKVLPAYMIPDTFMALKSFPLTPNAKIDKKALPKPPVAKPRENNHGLSPRNKNEKLVAAIWSEVLEQEDLKISDDFFELGGHSLLAVKIMVSIEKQTGKQLPLATLFENSTIEKLARQLSIDAPEHTWESIVPIKTEGDKTPLFLIHGGGLNVLIFKPISEYLDKDQPVYGMQGLGLKKNAVLPSTLEEICALYVEEILQVSPEGPYALAGYSFGGFIAFEIAKQLQEMGKEIKLLGLLDTYAGTEPPSGTKTVRLLKKIKRQLNKIPFLVKAFIHHPRETLAYQWNYICAKFFKKKEDEAPEATYNNDGSQYDTAHERYQLPQLDLKVTLFRAKKRIYYLDDKVHLGWGKYALKGVEVHEIPGDHLTFLRLPHVKTFAKVLQSVLDKADINGNK